MGARLQRRLHPRTRVAAGEGVRHEHHLGPRRPSHAGQPDLVCAWTQGHRRDSSTRQSSSVVARAAASQDRRRTRSRMGAGGLTAGPTGSTPTTSWTCPRHSSLVVVVAVSFLERLHLLVAGWPVRRHRDAHTVLSDHLVAKPRATLRTGPGQIVRRDRDLLLRRVAALTPRWRWRRCALHTSLLAARSGADRGARLRHVMLGLQDSGAAGCV